MAGVDVLAAMTEAAKELRHWQRDHGADRGSQEAIDGLRQARAAVAELIEAHKQIAALDPETDSTDGFNEWGEAECFSKAQKISRAALRNVQGGA